MDKRQEKTLNTIIDAFTILINNKQYNDITIQDLLDESKISRSTFYAHFKTKDQLLHKISSDIFSHVFSHSLQEEKSHDFSKASIYDYTHLITHFLYHLNDDKVLIKGILSSQGKDIFLHYLKEHLYDLSYQLIRNGFIPNKGIPDELHADMVCNSFIHLFCYWISNDCKETPEKITEYFINSVK